MNIIYLILVGVALVTALLALHLGDKRRLRANKLGFRIAELEAFQHNHAKSLEDVMTTTPEWAPNRQGKSWLKRTIDAHHKKHPEVREAWDKAQKDQVDGRFILDDPYNVDTVYDKELGDRFRSSIARRASEATLMDITSVLHAEDYQGDPEAVANSKMLPGYYLLAGLDYSWLAPTHIKGVHPHTFKCGEWGEIIHIVERWGRPCFKVRYSDGQRDSIPLCDLDNYELK